MARTPFAAGNPNGQVVGPILIPADTEIAGIELRVEHGHGVIDARLHFRNTDGSTIPGNPQTDWLTDNTNADMIGAVLIPRDEVFSGLLVVTQAGYGVVNLRVKKRKRADASPAEYTDWVTNNMNATGFHEIEISETAVGKGLFGREQAGYGVINLAIDFEE